ncbi:MAG: hypothetical protein AB1644_09240 [Candidatus Zixiibacteriota bacterium]
MKPGYMTRLLAVALVGAFGLCLLSGSTVLAGKVQLPAGQAIKVKIDSAQKVSSGSLKQGDKVKISLAEPVVIGGVTIVEAGAPGTATVAEVQKAGKPGKGGMLKLKFEELQGKGSFKPAKGAGIKLDGEAVAKGGNKKIISFILGFGLLIKGGQGQFAAGTVLDAKIKEATMLEN